MDFVIVNHLFIIQSFAGNNQIENVDINTSIITNKNVHITIDSTFYVHIFIHFVEWIKQRKKCFYIPRANRAHPIHMDSSGGVKNLKSNPRGMNVHLYNVIHIQIN